MIKRLNANRINITNGDVSANLKFVDGGWLALEVSDTDNTILIRFTDAAQVSQLIEDLIGGRAVMRCEY